MTVRNTYTLLNSIYMAFVNIPLAKAGHMANPSGGGGKGRELRVTR